MEFIARPLRYRGIVTVRAWRRGADGLWHPGPPETFPNLITDAGLDALASALANGNNADLQVKYLAVGTDNTAPANGDTTLGTEVFRKQVTSRTFGGTTGEVVSTTYVAPAEANVSIEELGWFIGDATATADTGTLLAHVLYTRSKVNSEALQVARTDTFTR